MYNEQTNAHLLTVYYTVSLFIAPTCFNACAGDEIEKNEMGGVCSAFGGGERCVQGFGGKT
jgi:hypothetical protein